MRVGVIGINHKLAHLKLRELLGIACQRRFSAGCSSHGELNFVLLSTCNRTEIYFSSEDLADTHSYLLQVLRQEVGDEAEDFNQKLYSYFSYDCFVHLSRVTAGLDSAIVAETEIQGQVKAAYELAAAYTQLPSELHFLFQKALGIGKRVRSSLPMGRGAPGLEDAIFNIGSQTFSCPQNTKVLFVGASEINRKVLLALQSKGVNDLTLCNRSFENAQKLYGDSLQFLKWEHLQQWPSFNWIICATKARGYLLQKNELSPLNVSQKLIIDLSVPRNVEPALARDARVSLFNIDQVNNTLKDRKQKMQSILSDAESLVLTAVGHNVRRFTEKTHIHTPAEIYSF